MSLVSRVREGLGVDAETRTICDGCRSPVNVEQGAPVVLSRRAEEGRPSLLLHYHRLGCVRRWLLELYEGAD